MPIETSNSPVRAALAALGAACLGGCSAMEKVFPPEEAEPIDAVGTEIEAPEEADPMATFAPRLKPAPDPDPETDPSIDPVEPEPLEPLQPIAAAATPAGFSPSRLIGHGRERLRSELGAPDAIRIDSPAITWLYESPLCALSVSFYSTVDGEEYKALQYRVSAPESALAQSASFDEIECVLSILSR